MCGTSLGLTYFRFCSFIYLLFLSRKGGGTGERGGGGGGGGGGSGGVNTAASA